ncbi:putative 1-phosphofructokinase [Nostocoides japonicum T1-X7]|uniref:Putative 1-phosphofructokinase n=1 Tax=Nostocoides japonicum T1-X7 TaxID=1194083 RepID=A0A077M780_9MICO|nr:1-phosphofructokinase family hexose kinase [Tetrasphaera japonica]CCH80009.1 putative 1-phosphofructokinase [Tetrasphaera japonica T1-X7]
MIVTVTLNPSLDLTYALEEATLGDVDVHRARTASVEASGKGVNVSRTLHAAGVSTLAVLPAGGGTGQHLLELLEAEGVDHVGVPVGGETRINTSLLLRGGDTVKVNGPGTPLEAAEIERLLDTVERALVADESDAAADERAGLVADERAGNPPDRWLAICGSLPPGISPTVVGDLVELAHRHTARCAVDVSGEALTTALEARADLLAPNRHELGEIAGDDLSSGTATEVAAAAHRLAAAHGVELLVSMGGDGAVHTDGTAALHGSGPVLVPVNTAGAGDAFLSGWLAGPGRATDRMARALAWGRSACLSATTVDPTPGRRGTEGIIVTTITPA